MTETEKRHLTIVGLGNPGKKYEMTRHNIGYLVVRALARLHGWTFKDQSRYEAQVAGGDIGSVKVHLLLPTTYMNESGRAVRRYIDFFKIPGSSVVAVVDDVDLPFGMMRLREKGSAGGHNGLKSLERCLGTQHYPRLRLGIGSQRKSQELGDHVLSRFTAAEMHELSDFIDEGVRVLIRMTQDEVPRIMNDVNQKITKEDLRQEGQEKTNESREEQSL